MPLSSDTNDSLAELLIIGLARTGDREAFAVLVQRRQSWIRNLMRRCCGDIALADDLAQQAFLQAWKDIGRLRQPRKFDGWLKRLAINTWLQHLRKNDVLKGADKHEDQYQALESPTSMGMDLDSALAQLTGPIRTCVVLAYNEGMSHGEIAKLTKLPMGTVKSHIRRGAKRLQQHLSAYQELPLGETV